MSRPGACALLLLSAAVLGGCGKSEGGTVSGSVAARVNSQAIGLDELERRAGAPAPEVPLGRREALEQLIDQRLASQRATRERLERSPRVAQAIEAATSEILARAHLEQVAASLERPTPEEIRAYYAAHPELFAERRIYSLEEIAVPPHDGVAAALLERARLGASMDEIAAWLESLGLRYTAYRGSSAAEQVPRELLPKLQGLRPGEVHLAEGAGSVVLVRMVAARPAPLDEAAAAPSIERFLARQRAQEAAAQETRRLRGSARIEYAGEFARRAQ